MKGKSLGTEYWIPLSLSLPRKSMVRLTDLLDMTMALNHKPNQNQLKISSDDVFCCRLFLTEMMGTCDFGTYLYVY